MSKQWDDIKHVDHCVCIGVFSMAPDGSERFHEFKMVCDLCFDNTYPGNKRTKNVA